MTIIRLKKIVKMILPAIAILKTASAPAQDNATSLVSVIELRNYVLKPGMYDQFRSYFAKHFVQSQIDLGGYPLVGFKVKGAPDNFFWIRGFKDMGVRSSFLPAFYYGPISYRC